MIPAVVAQTIGLVLLLVAVVLTFRHRHVVGLKSVPGILAGSMLCIGVATTLMYAVLLQEKTGMKLGISGGIASDARAWIKQHESAPPKRGDVGQNIHVLSDAITFLKAHLSELPAPAKATFDELSRVPPKPTRLLSVSEETQYFQAAQSGYSTIQELAGPAAANK
jgi:hypothetical protein